MKINTFNVVEYVGDSVVAVHAFDDYDQAVEEFREIAKVNGFDSDITDVGLDHGKLENSNGDYQLFFISSQPA